MFVLVLIMLLIMIMIMMMVFIFIVMALGFRRMAMGNLCGGSGNGCRRAAARYRTTGTADSGTDDGATLTVDVVPDRRAHCRPGGGPHDSAAVDCISIDTNRGQQSDKQSFFHVISVLI